jgi:AICAR transformylase/IMP cyclohydrolase PurH
MSQPIGKFQPFYGFDYSQRLVCSALLSVYDKSNLIDLATGLHQAGVRLLGSGGTAKKIREAGIPIECVHYFCPG